MKYEYQRIDLRSIEGIKKAERLREKGWKMLEVGIDCILFERGIKCINTDYTPKTRTGSI